MLDEFLDFGRSKGLFLPDKKVLLAVSGGLDSVVLAHLFYISGMPFGIAHVNFSLRGDDSYKDAAFVEDLASQYKVPFHTRVCLTEEYAKNNGISIQMAARDLRYDFFNEIMQDVSYTSCATAHHADDHAETFFVNLLRGTGLKGLRGILPKRDKFIHPLLFASRKMITEYAEQNRLSHREDNTNASDKYLRNYLRHHIIPVFKEKNPNFVLNLSNTMDELHWIEEFLNENLYEKEWDFAPSEEAYLAKVPVQFLKNSPFLPLKLRMWLRPYQFHKEIVSDLIKHLQSGPITGLCFDAPQHFLKADKKYLYLYAK